MVLKEDFYKEICHQQKVVGLCKAAMPRFYYEVDTKSCKFFTYGGCMANKNNFETKKECEEQCVGRKSR